MAGGKETVGAMLALDLGTSCGYAVLPPGGSVISGTIDLKSRRFEGGGMRYLRFRRQLDEMLATYGRFHQIVFEEVRRHQGVDAAHVYGGLLAILATWAEERSIPFEGVPVGTWKKSLTKNGNASKQLVKETVCRLGFPVEGFDEADAVGILLWAEERVA
jgi:Holliday junction resolvasome RuvABC endonuclease subunit